MFQPLYHKALALSTKGAIGVIIALGYAVPFLSLISSLIFLTYQSFFNPQPYVAIELSILILSLIFL
jgi:hypothetical protein